MTKSTKAAVCAERLVMHESRSCRPRWLIAMLGLLAVLAAPTIALGQADDMLPGPMSTPDLGRYMDRLRLSPQQELAVEAMHDQYKREYRELQEQEFDKFGQFMQQVNGMFPAREDVKKLLDMQDSIHGRIRAIDERLFDQMQSLLTEDQLATLPRVRLTRQRERYLSNEMMWSMGQRPVDVSELYYELELEDDAFETTDPLVFEYERRVTRDIARLHKATTGMFMRIFNELEKAGYSADNSQDPEQQMAMMQEMQSIFMKVSEDQRELGWDVHDQGKRLFTLLFQTLPSEPRTTLRSRYYREAYPRVGWMMPDSVVGNRKDLEKVTDLTEEQRDQLEAQVFGPADALDRELDDIVKVLEEISRKQTPFNFDPAQWEEEQEVITKFQERVTEFQQNIWKNISDILTPDQMNAFTMARSDRLTGNSSQNVAAAAESSTEVVLNEHEAAMVWGPDQFIAREITQSDIRLYGHVMGLSDDHKTLLRELHKSYMDRHQQYQRDSIEELNNVTSTLWQHDEDTGAYTPPTMDMYEHLYKVRETTLEKLRALDRTFFDDVAVTLEAVVGEDTVERIRLMRERNIYNRGHWNSGIVGKAGNIDVAKFVLRMRLSDAERDAIDPIFDEYEQKATALFKQKYEAAKRWQRTNDEWNAFAQQLTADGTFDPNSWQQYQERLSGPTEALEQANKTLADLNTSTFENALAHLNDEHARMLRQSFLRVAFPMVYSDYLSPERHFEAALALDTLTAEQRSRLEESALEYTSAYHQINEQLVELYGDSGLSLVAVTGQEEILEAQRRRDLIARLTFDRSELNSRGVRHLKQILSPEQIDAIGGLPEVPKH